MNEDEKKFKELLHILDKEGTIKDVILIGSWCLLFYKYIFENFEPSIRTTDIDFYVPNAKSFKASNGLIGSMKNNNYDAFNDVLTHKTTFISPDGFEVEFLTNLNRQRLSCIKLGNTQIFAESLPHVNIFEGNYIEINYDGMIIKVASPASYILQKMLIHKDRKDKKEKDAESIKNVLFYLNASEKYKQELKKIYIQLPNKWKSTINKVALEQNIPLIID